jgi:hypothetical protein
MCRQTKKACTLLGTDPSKWDPFEPVRAIPAVAAGFVHFERAVRLAAQGDLDAARASLREIQGEAIQQWYIDHAQVSGSRRLAISPVQGPCQAVVAPRERPYPYSSLSATAGSSREARQAG